MKMLKYLIDTILILAAAYFIIENNLIPALLTALLIYVRNIYVVIKGDKQ